MFTNSHFALATHILAILTFQDDAPVTSAQLAESVNTNAAFVRLLLGRLKKAGLVAVSLGKGGGARLARRATKITLLDVYEAVDPDSDRGLHQCEPSDACIVGRNIVCVLEDVLEDAEAAARRRLARRTIADIAKEIVALG